MQRAAIMHRDVIVKLIGAAKLIKALALILAGLGLVKGWVLRFDPDNDYANRVLAHIASMKTEKMEALGVGSFVYAGLFATEGFGLLLRTRWGEYPTVAITTSFIPFEIYELVEHKSVLKGVVIAANVAVVLYLVWKLRRDKRWPFARSGGHRRGRR